MDKRTDITGAGAGMPVHRQPVQGGLQ